MIRPEVAGIVRAVSRSGDARGGRVIRATRCGSAARGWAPDCNDADDESFPVRVYYEDTDMAGVVYYANYLKFIERGRSELVEWLGLNQREMRDRDGVVFVVTRVGADYLAPARLDDRWWCGRPTGASPVRWVFDQEVLHGDRVLFRAEVTAVCMTLDGRPTRLPAALRGQVP